MSFKSLSNHFITGKFKKKKNLTEYLFKKKAVKDLHGTLGTNRE